MKTNLLAIAVIAVITTTSLQKANAQNWLLTGNPLTNPATNFLGTTDAKALAFRTKNAEQMRITVKGYVGIATSSPVQRLDVAGNINILFNSALYIDNKKVLSNNGTGNFFAGENAGISNVSGSYISAIGYHALFSNTIGSWNTANGYNALYSNTVGFDNTALGNQALFSNIDGSANTASGSWALYYNTKGNFNTASGANALYTNTTGNDNTAIGVASLINNKTGYSNVAIGTNALNKNIAGNNLVAIGDSALFNNGMGAISGSDGAYNIAIGSKVLYRNTTGFSNSAVGFNSLYSNTTGFYNTAMGYQALYTNNNGTNNTAFGSSALEYNTIGGGNSALGLNALENNTEGSDNTAVGVAALIHNESGNTNAAIGYAAMLSSITGTNNTVIGAYADVKYSNLNNATAIGYNAIVDSSNKVRIGNTSVRSIGGQVSWTTFSDGRYKKNIKEDVQGLAFINRLRPITYTVDINSLNGYYNKGRKSIVDKKNEKEEAAIQKSGDEAGKIIYNGFVAQEVEAAAQKLHYNFSGVDNPKNKDGLYGLRYSDFVVPLVKAVQELSKQNDSLKERLDKIEQMLSISAQQNVVVNTAALSSARLEQNNPNPFNQSTIIKYYLAKNTGKAGINITDQNGRLVKTIELTANNNGKLILQAGELAAGTYQYTLTVNGKSVDSKKMVLLK